MLAINFRSFNSLKRKWTRKIPISKRKIFLVAPLFAQKIPHHPPLSTIICVRRQIRNDLKKAAKIHQRPSLEQISQECAYSWSRREHCWRRVLVMVTILAATSCQHSVVTLTLRLKNYNMGSGINDHLQNLIKHYSKRRRFPAPHVL